MEAQVQVTKKCTGPCGLELTLDRFGKGNARHGRKAKCKACLAQIERGWREANSSTEEQKIAARARAKAWAEANPGRVKANQTAWAKANPEKVKAKSRKWNHANPEKVKANAKRWASENRGRVRQYSRDWQAENRDLYHEIQRRWRLENVDYWRVRASALKKVLSDFLFENWVEILDEFNHRCAYCLRGDVKLTMDHVIPLSKGGPHTRDNIVPACKPCNSKKKDRPITYMLGVEK